MSNLSGYRDLSPNLVLGSYYPELDDSGGHSSESSECSRLAWEQSQFSSSRSRSRLSTTTESSQENYSALLQANQKLEREKLVLEAKLGALEQAYSLLAQSLKPVTPNPTAAIPVHSSLAKSEDLLIPLNMLPAAEREHYPLVKFWYRHEWTIAENNQVAHIGAHGKARAAQGENVTLRFIEDENRNIIDGFRATSMRRLARELWAGLNGVGKAPKTWGKVDAAVASQYRNEMERKFSELRLCDNSWKADFIATLNYPSWYNNNVEKEEHLKRSSVDPPPVAKRPRASADGPVTSTSIHPSSHTSNKKRSKHSARIPNFLSTEGLKTPGDNSHSTIECDPPVDSLSSQRSQLSEVPNFLPLTEGLETPGDNSHFPIECDPPVDSLGSGDPKPHPRSRVKNPLFSVPSVILNLEKNNQALATSPHIISMTNEAINEELALTSQIEIPTATTTMTEQMTSMTAVNLTATTTGVHQMMVDQLAPETVMDPAVATMNRIATEIGNPASPIYFDMTTGETTTIPQVVAPATTAPANAPAMTAPANASVTTAPANAPTMTAPADASFTTAPTDAPATTAPADFPPPVDAFVPPIVGSGTGKKAGVMRPNPHSTTARNLCALDWKEHNPSGSTTEFKHYYDRLSMEQKKIWKDREASMKAGPAHA